MSLSLSHTAKYKEIKTKITGSQVMVEEMCEARTCTHTY